MLQLKNIHIRLNRQWLPADKHYGRVAQLLITDGNATKRQASRSLTSGVGGGIFEVNGLIDFDIRFLKPDGVEEVHSIYIRALISPDIRTDLIIGLPTIKKYNLLYYYYYFNLT